MPIYKSAAKLCYCRFRNRQPKALPLPILKSAAKLCRCRFRNRQPQIVPLPILKLTAKYCVDAYPEIGSRKLCRCWYRNQQQRSVPLPIQKSAAIVESFLAYFLGVYINWVSITFFNYFFWIFVLKHFICKKLSFNFFSFHFALYGAIMLSFDLLEIILHPFFFSFLSMRLYQSYVHGCKVCKLTRFNWV